MIRQPSRRLLLPALLAAAIAPLSLAAQAGDAPSHRGPSPEQREALFDRAGIDAATRDALEEAREEHRQAMQELREEHRQRIDEILDDEQREAIAQARQELREERWAEQREAREQRLNALFDEWQLSDEQRDALQAQRDSFRADMQALRERDFDDREAKREAWQALREQHHAALAEVLDEQQIQALVEAMRGPGGHHGKGHHGRGHQSDHHGEGPDHKSYQGHHGDRQGKAPADAEQPIDG